MGCEATKRGDVRDAGELSKLIGSLRDDQHNTYSCIKHFRCDPFRANRLEIRFVISLLIFTPFERNSMALAAGAFEFIVLSSSPVEAGAGLAQRCPLQARFSL